jgi:hypothetical protein
MYDNIKGEKRGEENAKEMGCKCCVDCLATKLLTDFKLGMSG